MAIELPCLDRTRQADRAPEQQSFSVIVVLPASGWEMIAKVRRRATSAACWAMKNSPKLGLGWGWEKLRVVVTVGGGAAAQKAQRFLTRILNAVRGPGGNHHRITGDHGETLFPPGP